MHTTRPCKQLFNPIYNFVTLHENNHRTKKRFVYVVFFILKKVLKDIKGGLIFVELIIDLEPIHFIPKHKPLKEEVHF